MPNELGKVTNYEIHILPTHNKGFNVHIGCARLCYADTNALIGGLQRFLNDPEGWEKKYTSIAGEIPTAEATPREPRTIRREGREPVPETRSD